MNEKEIIKAEIERRIKELKEKEKNSLAIGQLYFQGVVKTLRELLQFIDSIPE